MAKKYDLSAFSPQSPPLRFLSDGYFALTENVTYIDRSTKLGPRVIVAPSGLITDFASFPELPTGGDIFNPMARQWGLPAIIHDALYIGEAVYGGPEIKRKEADRIFRYALKIAGTGFFMRWAMWAGVRAGGRKAWRGGQARDLHKKNK